MSWTRAAELFLLPPNGLVFLVVAGLLLLRTRARRLGCALTVAGTLALYLLCTPLIQAPLLRTLDRYPAIDPATAPAAAAVVVLGAGTSRDADGDVGVSPMGRERLQYGAWLHRQVGRPVLVTGFSGALMATELEESFAVEARWIEGASGNTHQSARRSRTMLHADGVARVYLVTHFWHMPRAVAAFRHVGLAVVPAPMGFPRRGTNDGFPRRGTNEELAGGAPRPGWRSLLPSVRGWFMSATIFHEWAGRLWYRLRYGVG